MTSETFKIINSDGYLLVLFGDRLVRISGRVVFTNLENILQSAKESITFNRDAKNPEIYETGGVEIHNNESHFGLNTTGEVLTTFSSMEDLITKYPEFCI